ncbi:MAG TPA: hypothetical protein VLH19_03865 [Patescibacteria group bacterium]|nr:hypothetical protein [Patescibacteria group bacterium]
MKEVPQDVEEWLRRLDEQFPSSNEDTQEYKIAREADKQRLSRIYFAEQLMEHVIQIVDRYRAQGPNETKKNVESTDPVYVHISSYLNSKNAKGLRTEMFARLSEIQSKKTLLAQIGDAISSRFGEEIELVGAASPVYTLLMLLEDEGVDMDLFRSPDEIAQAILMTYRRGKND